jgi:phosphatidate cytidylyltransferase
VLRTRVVTAIIITAIGLTAVFSLGPVAFALLAAIILLVLGGWEAGLLSGLDSNAARAGFVLAICLAGAGLFAYYHPDWSMTLLLPGCLCWLLLAVWLTRPDLGREASPGHTAVKLIVLAIVLLTAWVSVVWLQAGSGWYVVLLMLIIAGADIGAYFSGRAIGGPKLATRISPGKTRSGAVGGLICAMLVAALATLVLPVAPFGPVQASLVALALAAVSIGGDLSISLLKRQRGLKDTSNILPGHGGILDRFDSVGAGLPFFALAVAIWGN